MLRAIAAASAIVLGTMQLGESGAARTPAHGLCHARCRNRTSAPVSAQDAMAAGVARIAVRAAAPRSETAALTREDRIALYLLFSLPSRHQHDQ